MSKNPKEEDVQQVMAVADWSRDRALKALKSTSTVEAAINYIFNTGSEVVSAAPSGGDADLQRVIQESIQTATSGNFLVLCNFMFMLV